MEQNDSPQAEKDNEERQLQIVVHAGPLAGKGFLFKSDVITFGRDDSNNIAWDDTQVSRHHARIFRQNEQLVLEDLGSMNGTLVNGQPIQEPHVLQPADIISIGSSVFGVKGFAAPLTVAITQVSPMKAALAQPPRATPSSPESPLPRPDSKPASGPTPAGSNGNTSMSVLAMVGVAAFIVLILGAAVLTAYFIFQGQNGGSATVPTVVITAPAPDSQVAVNQTTTVQATASDPGGVTRMELWVSGAKIAETASPSAQGQPTLTASLQWTPPAPGSYTLEVRAFNAQNQVNEPTAVMVNAVAAESTITPTPTPGTPTPTVPTTPQLTTLTDLNVRLGPGTEYDLAGLLPANATAEITGRSENAEWWQIRFAPAAGGVGWVTADEAFSTPANTNQTPIVVAPPTPTGTPTATATPTNTPTNTPPPATFTPTPLPTPTDTPTVTPTPTPTQVSTQVRFDVNPSSINGGECVQVSWNVTGVREVYYQGQGVGGQDERRECPGETTTYSLRVVKQDGTEQIERREVIVNDSIASGGKLEMELGRTIDFDNGVIPGNDFRWQLEDNDRHFTALSGVTLAVEGIYSSLDDLSREDCEDASFGEFSYLDGSDVIIDPANELTDGRGACYVTNEGRLGKMRFPRYNPGAIEVEWLTWD